MRESTVDSAAAPWHAIQADEVLRRQRTDPDRGLSADEAARRLTEIGSNTLAEEPPTPLWRRLARQFTDLVIWILIAAAVISGVLGEWADTAAILAIVLVNGIIGFVQEERAERAIASLRKLSAPLAKVLRDGRATGVPVGELVPGDIVELEAGDNVPADARLLRGYSLRVQEAALTGESVPSEKEPSADLATATPLGDRRTMVHSGTVVAAGHGRGVVVATGMQTELGRIAGLLGRWHPEITPLQRRLGELGKILIVVCLMIVGIIFALEAWRGEQDFLELLLLSASLAVAAVPEGLPAVVTLVLAIGLQRMVARNALVRKLPSVETLGSVTVICSDKTGTLTRNEMTVREIETAGGRVHVGGTGYTPRGEFSIGEADATEPVDPRSRDDLLRLLEIAAWCNNATIVPHGDGGDAWEVIGDPTEGALKVVAMKAGIEAEEAGRRIECEIPFDSERKTMSVVVRQGDATRMETKGAPEMILEKCSFELRDGEPVPLDAPRREAIRKANARMAGDAMRVLAFAYRDDPPTPDGEYAERELVFVGIAGMIDPPREEVRAAMATCRTAGIRPVMITGDHPATAAAIAGELEMLDSSSAACGVITGSDLDQLSAEQLSERVGEIAVYARVSAEHKLRVVNAWKGRGEVVAMTGDGVNDAPAVKAADIGIAMGITGTDVTKESSDMVLTDDNFASIVAAVEEGRGIYDNIQKFIHYLLSCNAGEVLLMFFAAVVGWPVPLLAIQILWINLVTDGLPALALGMEPAEPDIMRRHPRPPREPVITLERGGLILAHGLLIAAVCVAGFWLEYRGDPERLPQARTVTFCVAAFSQLLFAVGCRSDRVTIFSRGLAGNPVLIAAILVSGLLQLAVVTLPWVQGVFEVEHALSSEWVLIFGLSLVPMAVVELVKGFRLLRYQGGGPWHGAG